MLDRYGLARGVLVQPSVYGFDNRCLLDALDRAEGRLVGIAVPDPNSSPGDLEALHRRGVRGVRCNLLNPGGLSARALLAWGAEFRAMNWHVELHVDVEAIGDLGTYVGRFGAPVVIDHMGRPRPGEARPDAPGLSRLVDLVRRGGCFVKLSAPYRLSQASPPWRDVSPLARALLGANPDACLWASDWPHTDTGKAVDPDHLFEALDDWTGSPERRRTMMVDAPKRLYGRAIDHDPSRMVP